MDIRFLRRGWPAGMALVVGLFLAGLSCFACRPFLNSIWFEVTCTADRSPRRSFAPEDLLLDESQLPQGWEAAGEPYDPEERLPAEQTTVDFFMHAPTCPTSLKTGHYVYRFIGGAGCADMGYRSETPLWFAPMPGWGPWSASAELSYESTLADRFRLNCCTRQGSNVQTCQAVGQYKEYVVRFHTSIDPQHADCMSFSDLEGILVAIDERMAFYLGKEFD